MPILDDIMEEFNAELEDDNDVELVLKDKPKGLEPLEHNTLSLGNFDAMPLIKKFAFLAKNRQLEDQLIKFYCIDNTVFAFADNARYFYSTMIENVQMGAKPFTFNIPYKQFAVIIKAAWESKSMITIKVGEQLDISTTQSKWKVPLIDSKFELDTVLGYYGLTEYTDSIETSVFLEVLKMYLPFVSLSDDSLCINNGNIFCRSNHFYIWSDINLKDNYILNKDNIKLLLTLKDSVNPNIRLLNSEEKLIISCDDEIIAFDRVYDEQVLMKEITELRRKQGVALYKTNLLKALSEIDIYTSRDLTLHLQPATNTIQGKLTLVNRSDGNGIAETSLLIDSQLMDVTEEESYNISFNILQECVKCIKEEIMEIVTLNRSEYIQFRTPTINCILMVNY